MRVLALFIWEQWRQTYKTLAIVFAALVVFAVVAWRFKQLLFYIFALSQGLVISTAYLPALGAIVLLFLQENRGRVGFSYPRRMLVLPSHTFTLVAAPLLYRLAVIAFFGYATGWICDAFLQDVFFKGPQIFLLLTLVAALHAFVFLTSGYGAATGTALFAAAFVATLPGFNVFLQYTYKNMAIPSPLTEGYVVPDIGLGGAPVAAFVIVFWFFVAYIGARHARSEVAEDPVGGLVRVATRLTYFDREGEEFASPESAQQWLEWRRGAYLFPWLALALGMVLVVTLRTAADKMEDRFAISFYVLAVSPAIVASLVGYTVTRGSAEYQWFVGARPLSTMAIARARLRAGIKAVLWAYVLLGALFTVSFKIMFPGDALVASLVQDLRVITSTSGTYAEGVQLLAGLAVFTMLSVWALFWLARVSGVLVWLAVGAVGLWYYVNGGLYVIDPATGQFKTPTDTFVLAMAALGGTAGAFTLGVAVWKRYLSAVTLIAVLLVWLALFYAAARMTKIVPLGGPLVLGAWMLLPFVPLASIPLTLEWQRHR